MAKYQEEIFTILATQYPNPKTELNYPNNFCLLVAIILSAQSTDIMVNKATEKLFLVADSPKAILQLGIDNLKSYIKILGLYNGKASNIIKLSSILIESLNEEIPSKFEELCKLPGVGRKTAGVYLNCVYKMPIIAVDTHVFRVSNRLGLVKNYRGSGASNFIAVEKELNKNIINKFKVEAHHLMILHGRYCCKARKPQCEICKISHLCRYFQKITTGK